MPSVEEDKAAVLAVIQAETASYVRRDIEALSTYWVHSPQSRRIVSLQFRGTQVYEGWDAIKQNYLHLMEQFPVVHEEARVRCENMSIVINGDMAWASYNEIGIHSDDNEFAGTLHQLKIFHRMDGLWKMACIVVMQRAIDRVSCALIEISADRRVLWMNASAHEQIAENSGLVISGGRLRTRSRVREADLQDAVDWAVDNLKSPWPILKVGRTARAVMIGENEDSAPVLCWVMVEDGKILVSFNDNQRVRRRVEYAQGIYGLTETQALLACLLAQGHDLALASEKLGVSVNTIKTHLKRIFEKTGARSQASLVATLLSVEPPMAR